MRAARTRPAAQPPARTGQYRQQWQAPRRWTGEPARGRRDVASGGRRAGADPLCPAQPSQVFSRSSLGPGERPPAARQQQPRAPALSQLAAPRRQRARRRGHAQRVGGRAYRVCWSPSARHPGRIERRAAGRQPGAGLLASVSPPAQLLAPAANGYLSSAVAAHTSAPRRGASRLQGADRTLGERLRARRGAAPPPCRPAAVAAREAERAEDASGEAFSPKTPLRRGRLLLRCGPRPRAGQVLWPLEGPGARRRPPIGVCGGRSHRAFWDFWLKNLPRESQTCLRGGISLSNHIGCSTRA